MQCNDCGDFDYTLVPPVYWNLVTDTYPVICCKCGECPTVPSARPVLQQGPLPPRPQSFSWILDCIRYAIHHHNRAIWINVQTLAYLKQCGINNKTAEHIDNIMIKEVSAQDVFVPDEEILDRVSLLPSWSQNFPLHDYLDTPMHLLKGIIDDSMNNAAIWATLYMKNKRILEALNVRLEGMDNLQLTWLHVLPLDTNLTTGGWQSENLIDYLGVQMFNYLVCEREDSVKLRCKLPGTAPQIRGSNI
jgi:hypothetical protein